MNILLLRWSALAFVVGLGAVISSGCAVSDGGYGYGDGGVDVGVGVDYYEPYGVAYGGWGPGYRVGPFRDGDHRPGVGGDHRPGPGGDHPHAFKPAAASRPMPSIPSHSRSSNSR